MVKYIQLFKKGIIMANNIKGKLLILGLSLLILVIVIYSYGKITDPTGEGYAVFNVIGEAATDAYDFVTGKITDLVDGFNEWRAERKAEKARKQAEKELETAIRKENILGKKYYVVDEDGNQTDEYTEVEAVTEEKPEQFIIYKSEDGNRYVKRLGVYVAGKAAEYRYTPIRTEIGGVVFHEAEDIFYADAGTKIYGNPALSGDALFTTGSYEQFVCTGMSDKAVYQLITSEGQIVYGDGRLFKRYIELSDYTETIAVSNNEVKLNVDCILQNPVLPTGCEVTSLAIVLNYYGISVSKETLADQYLPKKAVGKANFYKEFVGNPRSASSYGCYAPVIVNTANDYFAANNLSYKAVDYTGSTFSFLLEKVAAGNPVIIWATSPMDDEPVYTTAWIVDGEYVHWKGNLHCLVMTGYNVSEGKVYMSDPLKGNAEYDMELFAKRFKQLFSQAVIIEPGM